ncbi:MAG: PQQ-binding-like beta-propeller repeat protein [Acidobacteriota bacterium]
MASEAPVSNPSPAPRPRWGLAIGLKVATAAALLWVLYGFETPRESERTLALFGVVIAAGGLALVWLLALSRLPWRVRLGSCGVLLALALAAVLLLEVRGVTGDLVPVVGWRWAAESTPLPALGGEGGSLGLASAEPWPQFLGPRRDAVAPALPLARDWEENSPRVLRRWPVGEGWSSFTIAGGMLLTQEQQGGQETVVAYDLENGEQRWVYGVAARFDSSLGGIGPRATPLVVGDVVFAYGALGRLDALELSSGELRWSRDVVAENGGSVPPWGVAASPLAIGDAVVVASGGPGASLAAYRQADGEKLWSAGDRDPSYSSPLLARLAGRDQVLLFSTSALSSFDPRNGDLLWEFSWPEGQPNVAQPVILSGDRVLVSTGYGIGAQMLLVEESADGGLTARSLWRSPRLKAKFTQIVEHEGFLYGLDEGVLTCIDEITGERRWKRGRYGHGQVLQLGDLLLVMAEDGELVLVEQNPEEWRELGSVSLLSSKTWAPPALVSNWLAVRGDREAVLVELPVSGSKSSNGDNAVKEVGERG